MYSSDRLIKKTSNINVIFFFSFCVRPSAPCPEESCPSDKLVTTAIALKVLEIAKQFFFTEARASLCVDLELFVVSIYEWK